MDHDRDRERQPEAPDGTARRGSGTGRVWLFLGVLLGGALLLSPLLWYLFVVVAFWLDPPCFVCL